MVNQYALCVVLRLEFIKEYNIFVIDEIVHLVVHWQWIVWWKQNKISCISSKPFKQVEYSRCELLFLHIINTLYLLFQNSLHIINLQFIACVSCECQLNVYPLISRNLNWQTNRSIIILCCIEISSDSILCIHEQHKYISKIYNIASRRCFICRIFIACLRTCLYPNWHWIWWIL